MAIALFDLDHTLLDIDSDHSWGQFLVNQQLVDAAYYRQRNDDFYQDYIAGTLDATAYNEFVFEFLASTDPADLQTYYQTFFDTIIHPAIRPAGLACVRQHQAQGDTVILITATNRFVTGPIAQCLGIPYLLATEPEQSGQRYTGRVAGQPCFREGKLQHLQQWLAQHGQPSLTGSYAYSDSFNDLPLLQQVERPHVVTPDVRLRDMAIRQGWPILDWSLASQ